MLMRLQYSEAPCVQYEFRTGTSHIKWVTVQGQLVVLVCIHVECAIECVQQCLISEHLFALKCNVVQFACNVY